MTRCANGKRKPEKRDSRKAELKVEKRDSRKVERKVELKAGKKVERKVGPLELPKVKIKKLLKPPENC